MPSFTPPPEPLHVKGEADVARHERAGRYAEALRRAQEVAGDPTCDPAARDRLRAAAGRLERYRAFQADLEAAFAEGPTSPRLRALVVAVEKRKLPEELADLPIVETWRARVRVLLGGDEYALLAMSDEASTAAANSASGPARRKELLAEAARRGAEQLEAARRRQTEREAAEQARAAGEAERALAAVAAVASPLEVPDHRGRRGGRGHLVAYDARGFTLRMEGAPARRFTWLDAPAATACDVLELALDLETADAHARIARAAARGALFPRAAKHLAIARRSAPERAFPPLEELERSARLVWGAGTVTAERADLRYAFDESDEDYDFLDLGFGWARLKEGDLHLVCPGSRPETYSLALLRVEFDRGFEAEVQLDATSSGPGELLLGTRDGAAAVGSRGVGKGPWKELHAAPRSGKVDLAKPLRLKVTRAGESQKLTLSQGGAALVTLDQPRATWPAYLALGSRVATMVVEQLRVDGHPDAAWLEEAEDQRSFRLEMLVDASEKAAAAPEPPDEDGDHPPSDTAPIASRFKGLPPLRLELDVTSAEDEVALEGVPSRARTELEMARMWARIGFWSRAQEHAREAVSLGRRRYWAAEYILARLEIIGSARRHDAGGGVARVRLDQAIAGVEGFAEALAARSELNLDDGRLAEARADAEAALAARPDSALAHMAMAWVLLGEGRMHQAVEEARLAAFLGEPHPEVEAEARRIEAQRDGPPWSEPARRETRCFTVETDLPAKADEVLAALEAAREDAPRLFPSLRARPGARVQKSKVMMFARAGDYHRHAYRVTGDRKEDTGGFFDPRSGMLYIFESKRREPAYTLMVIRHEATHQWCHTLGLELPYWANEAIADYVGGWDAQKRHSRPEPDRCRVLLQEGQKLMPMFELMTMSPAEFYSGNAFLHYAQAWSFVHYCMEGGDPRLKATLFEYLDLHSRGQAGDRKGQAGVTLEHIYAETFHQLDRKTVEEGWWKHVQKLGEEVARGE